MALQRPQTGQAEQCLGGDGAADEDAEAGAGHGDDGHERVFHGVAPDRDVLVRALGACRAHVVLTDRLKHARPCESQLAAAVGQSERDHRHDVALPRCRSRGREPAQTQREDQHQDHADQEAGLRCQKQRDAGRKTVDERVLLDCREHAQRDAEHEREKNGVERDFERDGQTAEDLVKDRLFGGVRYAQIKMDNRVVHVIEIPLQERQIVAEFFVESVDVGLNRADAEDVRSRIARDEIEDREDQERNAHDDRDHQKQTLEDKSIQNTAPPERET